MACMSIRFSARIFGCLVIKLIKGLLLLGMPVPDLNYLLDGLKSSPSIRMYHEIFADHNRPVGQDFDRVFSTVFQPESKTTKMVGFKVFYNHLTEDEWQKFLTCKDLKIIHLIRRNRLRTVISLEIAFKTGTMDPIWQEQFGRN